jgi:glutaredoxin-related protein
MARPVLEFEHVDAEARSQIESFYISVVKEVQDAVKSNKVVVVGMSQNPVVKKAKKALKEAGIEFKYLEYGSYLKGWKPRLAIKLWTGWPTYPQVFVNGNLIGGCQETLKALKNGLID